MSEVLITDTALAVLRDDVRARLSPGRAEHTFGVERAAAYMSERLCSEKLPLLRAAALLHDITKEYSFEKQLKICDEFGIILRDDEMGSPQVLHAITAAAVIPVEYPSFSLPELCGAVRWHTTGRAGMTLAEKIVFLADYIEDGRKYAGCVALRTSFMRQLDALCGAGTVDMAARLACLDSAVLAELDGTLTSLNDRGLAVNLDTLRARDFLLQNTGS